MSKTLLCLLLPFSFVLFFASGTPLRAGDPWAWPPEAGDNPTPNPTDESTIWDLNASLPSDEDFNEGLSGRVDEGISDDSFFFTERCISRERTILRMIWFDLLTKILH